MINCICAFLLSLICSIKWLALQLLRVLKYSSTHSPGVVRRKSQCTSDASKPARQRGKPAWVKTEVLRLKALMPVGTGVRKIAATFNRMQSNNTQASQCQHISKTFVANLIGSNRLEIHNLRTQVRTRALGAGRINQTWGIDLTGKFSRIGQLHFILGIIDHGSRRLLGLVVSTKYALAIGAQLACTAQQYGKPKFIRTDNERCFTSQVFIQPLVLQGIRMQRSDMHCPWQNGRIERLFGTLKQYLNQVTFDTQEQLQSLLDEFMVWYNTIRPHQHLQGRTPLEVWHGIDHNNRKPIHIDWWTGWSGMLSGARLRWT